MLLLLLGPTLMTLSCWNSSPCFWNGVVVVELDDDEEMEPRLEGNGEICINIIKAILVTFPLELGGQQYMQERERRV